MNTEVSAATDSQPKTLVISGFKSKLLGMLEDDRLSMRIILPYIKYQYPLVTHLLKVANDSCDRRAAFTRPKSIEGIVDILGMDGIVRELGLVEEVPENASSVLRTGSLEAYSVAYILAALAHKKLGRSRASEFFLVGLLHQVFKEEREALGRCSDELIRSYRGDERGAPRISDALEMADKLKHAGDKLEGGRKVTLTLFERGLYKQWFEEIRTAKKVLMDLSTNESEQML